jgi:phosphatidate cytidylyltransferase
MKIILNKNILQRIMSALAIGLIIIYAVFGSFFIFAIVILGISALMIKELNDVIKTNNKDFYYSAAVILTSCFSLITIKLFKHGNLVLFWFFVTIWTFDTFSMIGGKLIEGRKMVEKISPKKTWSGLLSGLLFSSIIGAMTLDMTGMINTSHYKFLILGGQLPTIFLCALALIGDLAESVIKRKYDVKDSGNLIPGHGGFLDRFDSILFAAPVILLLMVQ